MTLIRLLIAAGGLALAGLIIWAIQAGDFSAAGGWLTSDPWGIVTLTDLYLGFLFMAVIIWIFEPNRMVALAFILPLPFLGNVWAAIWMVWRLGRMLAIARSRRVG